MIPMPTAVSAHTHGRYNPLALYGGAGAGGVADPQPGCCGGYGEAGYEVLCPRPTMKKVNWTWAGDGNGAYEQVDQFDFVGENQGSWERQFTTTFYGWRIKRACLALALGVILIVIAGLFIFLPPARAPTTTTSQVVPIAAPLYDCALGNLSHWPPGKVHWCCRVYGKGCDLQPSHNAPQSDRPPSPPPPQHQQKAVAMRGRPTPPAKQTPPPTMQTTPTPLPPTQRQPTTLPMTPAATTTMALLSQSSLHPVPSPPQPPARPLRRDGEPFDPAPVSAGSEDFDCAVGFRNWVAGWSAQKKAWCCHRSGKGCPPDPASTTTHLPYDCMDGLEGWQTVWTEAKKLFCCIHSGTGCAEKTSTSRRQVALASPFDCHAGLSNWRNDWSRAKMVWCCRKKALGCHASQGADGQFSQGQPEG